MSLKSFHFVFIVASSILSAWFGAWSFREYSMTDDKLYLFFGVLSVIAVGGLSVYLGWFLRKTRALTYFCLTGVLLSFGVSNTANACAVCMGDPNSPIVASVNYGVLALLAIISGVLAVFAALFRFWAKREAALHS